MSKFGDLFDDAPAPASKAKPTAADPVKTARDNIRRRAAAPEPEPEPEEETTDELEVPDDPDMPDEEEQDEPEPTPPPRRRANPLEADKIDQHAGNAAAPSRVVTKPPKNNAVPLGAPTRRRAAEPPAAAAPTEPAEPPEDVQSLALVEAFFTALRKVKVTISFE